MARTSRPHISEQHSPMLERAGKYMFWLLVVAVLLARAMYFPINQPVASNPVHEAKTNIAR